MEVVSFIQSLPFPLAVLTPRRLPRRLLQRLWWRQRFKPRLA